MKDSILLHRALTGLLTIVTSNVSGLGNIEATIQDTIFDL